VDTARPATARRLGRWLGIGLLVFALLAAGGAWWLSRHFDHDRLVALLSAEALRQTGRQLHVDGRLSLRLLPWPAVTLEGVRLANPDGLSRPDMLQARSVVFEVSLRPLFSRRVELRRVTLAGVDLLLEADARGRGNWVFTPPLGPRTEPATEPAPAPAEPGTAPLLITLDRIDIDDSRLAWRGSAGTAHTLALPGVRIGRTPAGSTIDARLQLNGRPLRVSGTTGALDDFGTARPFPLDLQLESDGTRLSARGSIDRSGRRPRLDLVVKADALDLAAAKAAPAARPAGAAPPATRLFSAEPWPAGTLPDADGQLQFDIARLRLAPSVELLALRARLMLRPGRVDIDPLAFQLAGGSVTGTVGLRQAGAAVPTLSIVARAQGVTLEALAALAGAGGVTGGSSDLRVKLAGSARSAEQFARSLNGQVVLDAGPARLVGTAGNSIVGQIVDAVKPLTAGRFDSELKCLAVRLDFAAGVASFERTLAMQTSLADLVGSGRIDLGAETLDIALTPTLRQAGAAVGPALAPLVRLRGPLAAPKLTVDGAGTATSALAIGAALARGKLGALGQRLLGGTADPQPCVTALSGKPAPAAAPAAAPASDVPWRPWKPR
jgi:uncharacterized protein involved in outer membrane biogenesis